ncbi:hypothetical protein JHK84_034816 [Glycine max]|nr:hypothetical protein JHK84_034816 [Glycine max]
MTIFLRSRRYKYEALGSGRDHILKSISYRRTRAKQRKIFLTTYQLDSFTEPKSPKLNKVALKFKKIVASALKLSFDIRKESKVYSDVVIVVKADNQNEDIGLDYLDNEVGIMYLGSQLSSGQIPPFLQPGKNTTKVNVELKGENEFGVEMQKSVYRGLGERENSFVDNSEASHKACD